MPTRSRVLETGTRNASAWRITRPASTGRVRVEAMLAIRRSYGTGTKAWHETRVTAVSSPGDECHSGTYRDTLRTQARQPAGLRERPDLPVHRDAVARRWREKDSNLRRRSHLIYSQAPLTARESRRGAEI